MYGIIFDPGAIDELSRLPFSVRKRIFSKILSAKSNPFHFFIRLGGRLDYKLRVGDYRVIADIDSLRKQIRVTLVGHRRNVYKQKR